MTLHTPTALDMPCFTPAAGFHAAATACGLKPSGAPDLALVAADHEASAAAVFTTNRVQAAPVLWDREVLEGAADRIRAVVANSGCANACTGEPGLADARAMAARVAERLGCDAGQVLVLSTGVIGRRLDMERVLRGIDAIAAPGAGGDVARAILTTDTRPKTAAATCRLDGREVQIRGVAKGAGMIHPAMATMLAVITTDARIPAGALQAALDGAVRRSFNRISVDGDMSTNDTVLALASGASGAVVDAAGRDAFSAALTEVCVSLAKQIARDGEGATRLVEIEVCRARTEGEAHAIADRIATSALVRTAIHGGDPNWGRILAAAGTAAAEFDPARIALTLGAGASAVRVVERGLPAASDEARAAAAMREDPVQITLDLDYGGASATVWTCDLSAEYVAINAHYTT